MVQLFLAMFHTMTANIRWPEQGASDASFCRLFASWAVWGPELTVHAHDAQAGLKYASLAEVDPFVF